MRVLLTGGLGSLGLAAAQDLLEQGHRVRCLDLRMRRTERRARLLAGRAELHWGDVCDPAAVARAVEGQDVVIHCAAILYPDSEGEPERSRQVNVDGTRGVLDAMLASPKRPALVFPSSITVYGEGRRDGEPRRVDDPFGPGSLYAHHKVECEGMIRASDLPWTILRVGAAIEPGVSAKLTPLAVRTMFHVSLDTRVEWVHPKDVGRAMANAASRPEVRSKVLMIGGGPSCRVRQRDFFETAFGSIGIGALPEQAFGSGGFEMDWMDTQESQRMLDYQRHTWSDFDADFRRHMRVYRRLLRPIRPLARRGLLHFSEPWRESRRELGSEAAGERQ